MNEYKVFIDTGYSGFEIVKIVSAKTKEEAEDRALSEAKEQLMDMLGRMRVAKATKE